MLAVFLPAEIAKKLFIHPEICIADGALQEKQKKWTAMIFLLAWQSRQCLMIVL
jgi:hypothetical protein